MASKVLAAGDNGGVTEGTFFHHVRAIEDIKKQQSGLSGKMRQAKAKAKDDGIDIQDLEWALKQRAQSAEQQRKSHNNRVAYLKFMKMPIAEHLGAITEEISDEIGMSEEDRQKKWENDGYVAARQGDGRDKNPHDDPNSLGARYWFTGWERGQAENAKGIKKKPADKPAAPAAEKAKPQHEPEVQAASGRKAKAKGVSYWHNAETKKVYEVDSSQANPEGAVAIKREEYETLKAQYDKELEDDWNAKADAGEGEGEEAPEDPPAPPGMSIN